MSTVQELAAKVKALGLHMVGESADDEERKFHVARYAFNAAVDELVDATSGVARLNEETKEP
jgi:hypothetical protein